MQAIGKNLIVRPIEEERPVRKILFTTAPEKPFYYEVLSVGDAVGETILKVGDLIRVFEYGIKEFGNEDGSKLYIVPIENVYARK